MNENYQKHLHAWENEHRFPTLQGIASTKPSVSVVKLLEWTAAQGITLGPQALDMGCGKGRNALFLAHHGFCVSAFDAVDSAVQVTQERARASGVAVDIRVGALDESWPYPDESFDVLIDDTASMSIGYEAGIRVCRDEMHRVLKPGGYVLVYALAQDDPFLQRFPVGEEPNMVVTPDGKIERMTTPEELRACHSRFRLVHQELWSKSVLQTWERRTIWMLFQKPHPETIGLEDTHAQSPTLVR